MWLLLTAPSSARSYEMDLVTWCWCQPRPARWQGAITRIMMAIIALFISLRSETVKVSLIISYWLGGGRGRFKQPVGPEWLCHHDVMRLGAEENRVNASAFTHPVIRLGWERLTFLELERHNTILLIRIALHIQWWWSFVQTLEIKWKCTKQLRVGKISFKSSEEK